MKKIILYAALAICLASTGCSKHEAHKAQAPAQPASGRVSQNHASAQDDPPNSVSGAFSYYWADRDPTDTEPNILPGLLAPLQILMWKNVTSGNIFILVSASADASPVLVWSMIQFSAK